MKLSALLLLITALHVTAGAKAQKVSYSGRDVELTKVFSAIHEQTAYLFFYDKDEVADLSHITVSLRETPLEQAMAIILQGLPLEFEIQGNTIFITRKAVSAKVEKTSADERPAPMEDTLRGTVLDSTGMALQNASIQIKGTNKGTRTNLKGQFAMEHIRPGTVLVISYTGFANKEVRVEDSHYLLITLHPSSSALDATVIQAYGTTSRRFSVGSISTVDAATIERQPVTNVLLAIQGQLPGVVVNTTSGVPGSQVLIQVRGQNTMRSDLSTQYTPYDQPLFIIDGVPFAPQNGTVSQFQNLATAGSSSGGLNVPGGIGAIGTINPNDIESISVLKDADATSIYGSQGSNGVILITTKKGKPGKTLFNLSAYTGVNTPVKQLKLLNTQQYRQLRLAAFAADGITPDPNAQYSFQPGYAPDLAVFDSTRYTDWEHTIFGKSSGSTDVHGTLSGGSLNNTFLIGGGYTHSSYNYPGNFYDQRFTIHSVLHHNSTDGHLTVDFGMDYGYDKTSSGAYNGSSTVLAPPNLPALLDSLGNLVWNYKSVNLVNYQFYSFLKQQSFTNTYNLNNTLRLGYKIFSGLSLTANLGYSRTNTDNRNSYPSSSLNPLYHPTGTAQFGANNFQALNIEPQLDYQYVRGKSMITALIGGTYKKSLSNSVTEEGDNYTNDNLLGSISGAGVKYVGDGSSIYRYSAGFARVKYVYDQQYILSMSGRRDGSSNFGPGHQFGNFGSVGAGWIFSQQKGFQSLLPFVSYAKLAGNYGTSGSDGVTAYQFQSLWQPVNGYPSPSYQGIAPSYPVNLYNPDYSWALKKSLNLSFDLGFFHDQVLFNATFYRNREQQQLAGYPLASQVGLSQVLENTPGNVQNKGWEFSVTSTNIRTRDFSWSTNFNITFNRNKLLSFPNLENSSYSDTYIIGKPLSTMYGYKYKGVNPTSGLFEYYDHTGKVTSKPGYGTVAEGGDEVPIGDREVKFMGGFTNSFSYRQFSLTLFFQFSSQNSANYLDGIYSASYPGPGANLVNMPVAALNYWKKPGDVTPLQRLTAGSYSDSAYSAGGRFTQSSGAFSNDFYVRLKTVAFSYSLSKSLSRKLNIQDCRFFINAQNLLTFTNYKVADPESNGNLKVFPLQRTVVVGLSLNF